jgi:hypothetical protein
VNFEENQKLTNVQLDAMAHNVFWKMKKEMTFAWRG